MAIDRKILDPAAAPPNLGRYSHVARLKADELLFVAGQVGFNVDGKLINPGDVAAQTKQTFANIGAILESQGAGFGNVVEFTTYLTSADFIPAFMEVRTEVFSEIYPNGDYPPNTLLVVDRLGPAGAAGGDQRHRRCLMTKSVMTRRRPHGRWRLGGSE